MHEKKVLLIVRIVQVNAPENIRLHNHGAGAMVFKQPVLLRIANQSFDDEFDHSGVVPVTHAITLMNLVA